MNDAKHVGVRIDLFGVGGNSGRRILKSDEGNCQIQNHEISKFFSPSSGKSNAPLKSARLCRTIFAPHDCPVETSDCRGCGWPTAKF
jgi:hypothetical protein